jgi:hypothetical protein
MIEESSPYLLRRDLVRPDLEVDDLFVVRRRDFDCDGLGGRSSLIISLEALGVACNGYGGLY